MCGIAGYIGKSQVDRSDVERTLGLMGNRGPDHCGWDVFADGDASVVMLHSRLSIIDLDARSNQPMTIDGCSLVFNGEIYNYVELRGRLEKAGVVFETESDTEVLLRSYLEYGKDCVKDFEGMWSFALYDRRSREVLFSRDRFGEKPLYLFETSGGLYFGSEVKFIRSLSARGLSVNYSHLYRYLVNGYKSLYKTDETFYEGVWQVPYASNLTVSTDMVKRQSRYWEPLCRPIEMSVGEAIEGFGDCLKKSISMRLRSDVPVAFCLSGGIDSASIVSIAAKCFGYDVATFSLVDSDERYNERDNIQATIEDVGCRHTIIDVCREGFIDRLRRLVGYHDSPISTISYYIHSFLSEAISGAGYKVVCSGTGADELVTGYYDHFNLHLYEMRNHVDYAKYLSDWQGGVGGYIRNPHLKNPRLYMDDPQFRGHIYLNRDEFRGFVRADFDENFYEEDFGCSLLRNRMLNELFHEVIPVILHEDDMNSMMFSVENRSPYLDRGLFEFANSIPSEHLIREGYGKYVLRESVKGILNDKVRLDPKKVGFNAALSSVFDPRDSDNREWLMSDCELYDYVDREKVEGLLRREFLPNSYSKFLFNLINAKLFLELHSMVGDTCPR